MIILELVIAAFLGFVAGWYVRGLRPAHSVSTPRRTEPWDPHEHARRRDRLDRGYTDSMNQYDKLVPWASGGALVLSVTFIEKFGQNASPNTGWLLGTSWVLLGLSLLSSLLSQYASTRMYSWRLRELEHVQQPLESRAESWAGEARRFDRLAGLWGTATKWLTFLSGVVLLVGGLMFLARFAYLNAPFRR